MDVITTATATATAAVIGKSPERDIDAPPRIQPSKATNGVLKRHFLPHARQKEFHASLGGVYKECLKNHAASIGGHALDGCGEFMPAPTATAADPTSLKCAACGCHRNFHRREPEDFPVVIEYHPHHRHHPLPPPTAHAPPPARESHSPPPISSYPHMLLALSGGAGGGGGGATQNLMNSSGSGHPSTRKRFRTKFTQEQKEKMFELAERVGWKMQKTNEDVVNGVCSDIGVERGVFKVWMHNNKNTFAKRSSATNAVSDLRNGKNDDDDEENNNGGVVTHHTHLQEDDHHHHHHHHHHHYNGKSNESNAPTNASSSSS